MMRKRLLAGLVLLGLSCAEPASIPKADDHASHAQIAKIDGIASSVVVESSENEFSGIAYGPPPSHTVTAFPDAAFSGRTATGSGKVFYLNSNGVDFSITVSVDLNGGGGIGNSQTKSDWLVQYSQYGRSSGTSAIPEYLRPKANAGADCGYYAHAQLTGTSKQVYQDFELAPI